ncbi:MAG: hypothetical protein JWM14_1571 [Chitinophagaceae bacterium]|nr:hypothetical protein [Chitinophagaceae bacterium]
MSPFLIAVLLFMLVYFIGKILNERATKLLEPDKKLALIDAFSGMRIYTISTVVAIMVLYFINIEFNLIAPETAHTIYIICLAALLIVTNYLVYKKLKEQNFPASYIKFHIIINAVRFVGIMAFLLYLDAIQHNS